MKKKNFFKKLHLGVFVLSFFLVPSFSYAQREIFKVGEISFFSSCILDKDNYLIVGDLGRIYKTENGGKKWSRISSSVTSTLYSISQAGKETLLVSGAEGLILKSVDGGKSWQRKSTGTKRSLFSISFYDEFRGIVVGDWGTILYTEDGGETWKDVSWKEDIILYDVCFADRENVWIVGELGTLLQSNNGGKNWKTYPSPVQSTLTSIDFNDRSKGIFVGIDGMIFETQNSGRDWHRLSGFPTVHFYGVAFKDSIALCVGDYSTIFYRDSKNWTKLEVPSYLSTFWLSGVSVKKFNDQVLTLIAGKKGIIILDKK